MISCNKGKCKIKGTEPQIQAELSALIYFFLRCDVLEKEEIDEAVQDAIKESEDKNGKRN